jgi:hypothetical protein
MNQTSDATACPAAGCHMLVDSFCIIVSNMIGHVAGC